MLAEMARVQCESVHAFQIHKASQESSRDHFIVKTCHNKTNTVDLQC